jgi:hypothetical protein
MPESKSSTSTAALPRAAARAPRDRAPARLRSLQRDLRGNAWKIGRELAQVASLGLHRSRGFDSLKAYADATLGISRDTALQAMRVAEAFGERMVIDHGVEKLDRALRYLSATPERDAPGDLPAMTLRVPDAQGDVREVPFAEVTIAQIRAATRAERESDDDAPDSNVDIARTLDADGALEVQQALNESLDEALADLCDEADLRVVTARGRPRLELRGVPLERADVALAALRASLRKALEEVWSKG